MSLALIVCRCGRRWYRFQRSRDLWDSKNTTPFCPGCTPVTNVANADEGWSELRDEPCICGPDGCAENFDDGDPRQCVHCRRLDSEWPCPADPATRELPA